VNYTGASSSFYISEVALLDSSGAILYRDTTKRTSGTTATTTIPDDTKFSLAGVNFKVRVSLRGDGSGSPNMSEITVAMIRSTISMALFDAPWLQGFFMLLTLGLVGAFAI